MEHITARPEPAGAISSQTRTTYRRQYYIGNNSSEGAVVAESLVVRKVGNSAGVTLGKELLEALNVSVGEKLYVVRTPTGIQLTPYDPDFAQVMKSTRDYMRRHRNAMQELAKR